MAAQSHGSDPMSNSIVLPLADFVPTNAPAILPRRLEEHPMRDDMHRVLVTRPRLGAQVRRKGRTHRFEDMPPHVGMKRTHAFAKADMKVLNEHLQPLRRYLHAQVGRPWDKVWSEIAAGLRVTSAVQQHVRDHVFDFVAKDVSLRGREVWVHEYGRERPLRDSIRELWVDPRTGILRSNRQRRTWRQARRAQLKQAERELHARMVPGKDNVQYHLLADGAWWEVTLARHPDVRSVDAVPPIDFVLDAGLASLPPGELYGREGMYAVKKRQLSRRDASRLGLTGPRAARKRVSPPR